MSGMAEVVDRRVRRTLANVEVWKDWNRVIDSTGRMQRQATLAEKLWKRVDIQGPEDCWEWQGAKVHGGHGQMHAGDVGTLAHRVAWALANGGIPAGKVICHTCDNPPCCNPAHLFIGTQLANVADCVEKGRNHRGVRTGSAVLTDDLARAIRKEYAGGGVTQKALARQYGVDQNTIWKVVNNVTWRHVA